MMYPHMTYTVCMYSLGFKILWYHSDFSRYNPFFIHLDIYYVHIHNKRNVGKKAKMTSILKRKEYIAKSYVLKVLKETIV
jgi:hypothetical protein